jgi:hypothetical protein
MNVINNFIMYSTNSTTTLISGGKFEEGNRKYIHRFYGKTLLSFGHFEHRKGD